MMASKTTHFGGLSSWGTTVQASWRRNPAIRAGLPKANMPAWERYGGDPEKKGQSAPSTLLPFEITRRLLATSEDVLLLSSPLPSTTFWCLWGWIRSSIEPLTLAFHGASRMTGSFGLALGFAALIPIVFIWLLQPLGLIAAEKTQGYINALWMLLALTITFSKPSRYALTGYTAKDVSLVIGRVPELYQCNREHFPALQQCLQRAEDDTKARLTAIKWVAGSVFALALLVGQKGFDLKDGDLLGYALLPLAIAIFMAGFIAVHARGTVAVYGLAQAVIHQLEAQQASRQQQRELRSSRRPASLSLVRQGRPFPGRQ
jgi:hypothetical protein